MSEDNPADESLPADVSLGVGLMSLDSNQDTPRSDSNGGTVVKTDKLKIDILLKATGNAPIMKKKKWAVDAEKPIGWIMEFVKKYLKLDANEKLSVWRLSIVCTASISKRCHIRKEFFVLFYNPSIELNKSP
ncbi:autophagy-related 12 isoform X2 [Arctopsyche grandis]|uniref:autophagy-related 12 isoform X2 n=1 Tax=Arctopsyche grandis TaxID=121162 RepID=UPI00406D795D